MSVQVQISKILVLRELKKLKDEQDKKQKQKRKQGIIRKCWVKPLLIKRADEDIENNLLKDLMWEEGNDFANFTRLNISQFEEILALVSERLKKSDTHMRLAITPRTKLAITLNFIGTGNSFKTLEYLTRVSKSSISSFIPQVLLALYQTLQPKYLKVPDTEAEWLNIANDFESLWQFPHTLGALDGKHIRIKAPPHTGSQFFNFKGFFSIILFTCVDAHSRFIFIDVGCNGKSSDSSIYQDGFLHTSLKKGTLHIPEKQELTFQRGSKVPFFFIGDDAFKLDEHLMKPFNRNLKLSVQEEAYNYRISRARMVVECAFERLASRFRIFHRPIEVLPSTVDLIVLASCTLHNFLTKLRTPSSRMSINNEEILPQTFSSLGPQQNSSYKYSNRIREELTRYCVSDGNVDFQGKKLRIDNAT